MFLLSSLLCLTSDCRVSPLALASSNLKRRNSLSVRSETSRPASRFGLKGSNVLLAADVDG
jgi:hypothetical protein